VHIAVPLEERTNGSAIKPAIALSARCPHSGPLAAVEHAELEGGEVSGAPHDSAKGIDLSNDSSLGNAANGGVARHLTYGLERACDQTNASAQTCGSDRRFGTGVTSTNYQNVKARFG